MAAELYGNIWTGHLIGNQYFDEQNNGIAEIGLVTPIPGATFDNMDSLPSQLRYYEI